jgi:hypothetical protein
MFGCSAFERLKRNLHTTCKWPLKKTENNTEAALEGPVLECQRLQCIGRLPLQVLQSKGLTRRFTTLGVFFPCGRRQVCQTWV